MGSVHIVRHTTPLALQGLLPWVTRSSPSWSSRSSSFYSSSLEPWTGSSAGNASWVTNLPDYDPNCASPTYPGDADHVEENNTPGYTCSTIVYGDGEVQRYLYLGDNYLDGDCDVDTFGQTYCYCSGDFCNSGLCEECEVTKTDI